MYGSIKAKDLIRKKEKECRQPARTIDWLSRMLCVGYDEQP
jgi:hypothetical protein